MLDMRGKEGEVEWEVEDIHPQRQAGLCLRSAPSSQGGYGILLAASPKTDLRQAVSFRVGGGSGEGKRCG